MVNKEFRSNVENRDLSGNTDNSALRQEKREVTSPYFLHHNGVMLKSI